MRKVAPIRREFLDPPEHWMLAVQLPDGLRDVSPQQFADVLAWEQNLDYRPVPDQMIDLYATPADRAKYDKEMVEYKKELAKWQKENEPKLAADPNAKVPPMPKEPKLQEESVLP